MLRGLVLRDRIGGNPYKFGMVGSTDSHTGLATAEEENFFGKHSGKEPKPERWSALIGDFDGDTVAETVTTVTDADGLYDFTGLPTNDGTGAGIPYTVTVDTASLPPGVAQTVDPDVVLDDTSTVTLTDAALGRRLTFCLSFELEALGLGQRLDLVLLRFGRLAHRRL